MAMVVSFIFFIAKLPQCKQNDFYECNELSTDQPDVHQSHIGGWGQLLHNTSRNFFLELSTDLIYLMKRVVMTNMTVRFTVRAASK